MSLDLVISGVGEVICAFGGLEDIDAGFERTHQAGNGSFGDFAQVLFGMQDSYDLFQAHSACAIRKRPMRAAILRIKRLCVSRQWMAPNSMEEVHGAG